MVRVLYGVESAHTWGGLGRGCAHDHHIRDASPMRAARQALDRTDPTLRNRTAWPTLQGTDSSEGG